MSDMLVKWNDVRVVDCKDRRAGVEACRAVSGPGLAPFVMRQCGQGVAQALERLNPLMQETGYTTSACSHDVFNGYGQRGMHHDYGLPNFSERERIITAHVTTRGSIIARLFGYAAAFLAELELEPAKSHTLRFGAAELLLHEEGMVDTSCLGTLAYQATLTAGDVLVFNPQYPHWFAGDDLSVRCNSDQRRSVGVDYVLSRAATS